MCQFCMKATLEARFDALCGSTGEGTLSAPIDARMDMRAMMEAIVTIAPAETDAQTALSPLDETPGDGSEARDDIAVWGSQVEALPPANASAPDTDSEAEAAPPPGPVFAFAPTDTLFAGLDSGFRMDSGNTDAATGQMIVTYAFAPQGFLLSGGGFSFNADTNWTAYEEQQISLAIDVFSSVLDIQFVETSNVSAAEIKFAAGLTSDAQTTEFSDITELGFAFFPGGRFASSIASSVFLNTDGIGWDRNDTAGDTFDDGLEEGGLGFLTVLHEVAHALGLDHSFEGNLSAMFPGLADDFSGPRQDQPGADGIADDPFGDSGSFGLNQDAYTVMSYRSGWTDHPLGVGRFDITRDQAGSLMALDIAALQTIYGANTATAAGNDVYALEDVTGPRGIYKSIWDTGGTDALDYGGTDDVVIDLRAATLQVEEGGGGFISHATTTSRGGYSIAADVVIENASTGSGDDLITGNAVANFITAGAGNDSVSAGDGDDIVLGGADNDTLDGGSGRDALVGEAGDDHLIGGADNDFLSGGAGNDTLDGGSGTLDIVAYADETSGIVVDLSGGASSGEIANDVLIGIEGYQGARDAANTFLGGADADIFLGGFQGDLQLGGLGADVLFGDRGADTLDGNGGADLLQGGFGNDVLRGGGADGARDVFVFEGSHNANRIEDFQVGEDVILFQRTSLTQLDLLFADNAGGVLVSLSAGNTTIQVDGASTADLTQDLDTDGAFDSFAFV